MKSRIATEKNSIQQEEDSLHKQMGLKFKKESSVILRSVPFFGAAN